MKRRLLIIAIFLLLGAVVNVAVAWGCTLLHPILLDGTPLYGPNKVLAARWLAKTSSDWPRRPFSVTELSRSLGFRRTNAAGVEPEIVKQNGPKRIPQKYYYYLQTDCAGLPVHSLRTELRSTPGRRAYGRTGWQYAVWLHRDLLLFIPGEGRLPIRPVWPGFAINAIFYAAILWLLIRGRRFLRLRRGLCPKCAYPMGESAVCTECGRLLPKRVAT